MKLNLSLRREPRQRGRHGAELGFAGARSVPLSELLSDVLPPSLSGIPAGPALMTPEVEAFLRAQHDSTLAHADECHTEAMLHLDAEKQLRELAAGIEQLLRRVDGARVDAVADTVTQPRIDYTRVYAEGPLGLAEVREPGDPRPGSYAHFADPDARQLAAIDGADMSARPAASGDAYDTMVIGGAR